jgi:hypothetical protein
MSDKLMSEIKKMEQERREASGGQPQESRINFEAWFHMRKQLMSAVHKKEVIMADFKSRGLESEATVEQFDRALRLYGIKF